MKISILTLFPEVFEDIFGSSIIGRAQKSNLIEINLINIRDFAKDRHKTVDDKPYGGGVGMIMRVDVLERAINRVKNLEPRIKNKEKVVLLDPAGKLFSQKKAEEYAKLNHLILVCGHYEGVDARVVDFVDEIISIGEYILTGGELATMVICDALIRLVPGVLSKKAVVDESFAKGKSIEAPQYTRPAVYKGYRVPKVLLSGNHQKIKQWRRKQSRQRTLQRVKGR